MESLIPRDLFPLSLDPFHWVGQAVGVVKDLMLLKPFGATKAICGDVPRVRFDIYHLIATGSYLETAKRFTDTAKCVVLLCRLLIHSVVTENTMLRRPYCSI